MFRLFLILLFLALSSTAGAADWVIDTDVGPDDAVAMLYLLKHPHATVKAITIESDGNANCKPAFANVQGLLKLTGQSGIPVACGRSSPLRGTHRFPQYVIDMCNSLNNTPPPQTSVRLPKLSAKDLLIQTLISASRPVNILAIGPLTTLAEVFEQEPRLKNKVHMIYIMGGAVKVPGNIQDAIATSENRSAEWNIYLDPYAAEKLVKSGAPLTLVPLDATNQAMIDRDFYNRMKDRHQTAAAEYVFALLNHNQKMLLNKEWYLWDPMAAVIGTDEKLARFETLPISVKQTPEALSGATVVDPAKGARVRVSMGIRAEEFKKRLIDGLNQN